MPVRPLVSENGDITVRNKRTSVVGKPGFQASHVLGLCRMPTAKKSGPTFTAPMACHPRRPENNTTRRWVEIASGRAGFVFGWTTNPSGITTRSSGHNALGPLEYRLQGLDVSKIT